MTLRDRGKERERHRFNKKTLSLILIRIMPLLGPAKTQIVTENSQLSMTIYSLIYNPQSSNFASKHTIISKKII